MDNLSSVFLNKLNCLAGGGGGVGSRKAKNKKKYLTNDQKYALLKVGSTFERVNRLNITKEDKMPLIRSAATIANKWKTVTPQRQTEYASNVAAPLRSWEKETLAAADRQKVGMQEALNDGRIQKGIQRAGQAKWQKATVSKGPNRWAEGVNLGEADYQSGFAPYVDIISKTQLPARFPKGDPRNWERSKALGLALHQKKIAG